MKCHPAAIVFVFALSLVWAVLVASSPAQALKVRVPPIPNKSKHQKSLHSGQRPYLDRRSAYGLSGSGREYDSVSFASTMQQYPFESGHEQAPRPVGEGSPVNRVLQSINWVAFGFQFAFPAFTIWGMKVSQKILKGQDLYRLFTPMFLHGSLLHLLNNSDSLRAVGPPLERLLGSGRYLSLYIFSGIVGNLVSALRSPYPSLGASGAVFGVTGSFLTLLAMNDGYFGSYGSSVMSSLAKNMVANVFFGFISPRIDNWGHIGGAAAGAAFTFAFGPRLRLRERPDGELVLVDVPLVRLPRFLRLRRRKRQTKR